MNEERVDAEAVINELLEQLKQANLTIAMLRVMVKNREDSKPDVE